MDAKQAAEKWGCSVSTVKKYCASGIILAAEKVGMRKKWEIPDNCLKPPMSRHGLCCLLNIIHQVNSGVEFSALDLGYSNDQINAGFEYLVRNAFMSTIDSNNLADELKSAVVTPLGKELIELENNSGSKTHFVAHMNATANLGVASIEIGGSVSNGKQL